MSDTSDQSGTAGASERQIELARKLREARDNAKGWGVVAEMAREELLDSLKEEDVHTVYDPTGKRVAWITQSTRDNFNKKQYLLDNPDVDLTKWTTASVSTTLNVD